MLIKHNMLISSYLFYRSVSVEGERNVADLILCSVEYGDMYSRAVKGKVPLWGRSALQEYRLIVL
jgi:hypothetical protein